MRAFQNRDQVNLDGGARMRVDARETSEGKFFRVRYRNLGSHAETEVPPALVSDEGGGDCEDETWTRVPAEGWAPLQLLKVRGSE